MKTLSAQDIAASDDHKIERVKVPEWGGQVFVRTMPGNVRDAYESACLDAKPTEGMVGIRARLTAFTVCDKAGKLLFVGEDGSPDLAQIEMLGERSAVALDRVFTTASRINHLRKEDIDELLGNSDGGRTGEPGSALPPTSE